MKRLIDLFIATIGIFLFFPIIVFTTLAIWIAMGNPVLFKQKRPGLDGEAFSLYKFRTMQNMVNHDGKALADDVRITGLGKFLRKYSLDELPQLLNVLKGDMSLVGPRPLLMEYLSLYNDEQWLRQSVKPGITGWAQVNGRNAITWEEKFTLDAWYVRNRSILLDYKILMKTILKVIKREGINQQDSVSMKKFEGSQKLS